MSEQTNVEREDVEQVRDLIDERQTIGFPKDAEALARVLARLQATQARIGELNEIAASLQVESDDNFERADELRAALLRLTNVATETHPHTATSHQPRLGRAILKARAALTEDER